MTPRAPVVHAVPCLGVGKFLVLLERLGRCAVRPDGAVHLGAVRAVYRLRQQLGSGHTSWRMMCLTYCWGYGPHPHPRRRSNRTNSHRSSNCSNLSSSSSRHWTLTSSCRDRHLCCSSQQHSSRPIRILLPLHVSRPLRMRTPQQAGTQQLLLLLLPP